MYSKPSFNDYHFMANVSFIFSPTSFIHVSFVAKLRHYVMLSSNILYVSLKENTCKTSMTPL